MSGAPGPTGQTGDTTRGVLTALTAALGIVAARCWTSFEPFPGWGADPFVLSGTPVGFGPAWALTLDGMLLVLSAVVLWRCGRGALALLAMAALPVAIYHARSTHADAMLHAVGGAQLLSAAALATAVLAACTAEEPLRRRARALCAGLLAGICGAVALKGGVQYFLEHAQTVETFRATQAQFFASQGWDPDSPAARAFLRRLLQPEATGWFGFANVVATLAAAGATLCAGLLWSALTQARTLRQREPVRNALALREARRQGVGLAASALLLLTLVLLAGSKGGYAALGAGLGLVVLGATAPLARWRDGLARLGRGMWLGPAVLAAVLMLVAVRGAVGERIGEQSVLFRWYYTTASARIVAEHPLTGVGPAAFKDAYVLAKTPRSPEDVASPHSAPWDWLATLGVSGLGLVALLLLCAAWAGRGVLTSRDHAPQAPDAPDADEARTLRGMLTLAVVLATGFAAVLESALAATPTTALVRVGCALLAGTLGWLVARRVLHAGDEPGASVPVALGAAGLAAAAHGLIELTPVTQGAGAWWWAVVALGGAAGLGTVARVHAIGPVSVGRGRRAARLLGVALVLVGAVWAAWASVGAWRWERALREGLLAADQVRVLVERRDALASGAQTTGDTPAALATDLASALGRPVPPTPDAIDEALVVVRVAALEQAALALERGLAIQPTHLGTLRAADRVRLDQALALRQPALAMGALERTRKAESTFARSGQYFFHRGLLASTIAEQFADPDAALRRAAAQDMERALQLNPYEWTLARQRAELAVRLGDRQDAARWAQRALDLSDALTADPIKQASPTQVARLRALANAEQEPPAGR